MGIYLIIILLISSIKTQEIDDIESKALQKYLNQTNEPVNLSNKLEDKCERYRNLKRVSERKDAEVLDKPKEILSNKLEDKHKNYANLKFRNKKKRETTWIDKNIHKEREYIRAWEKNNPEKMKEYNRRRRNRLRRRRNQPRIGLHHIVTETTNDPDTTCIESTTNDSDTTFESTTNDSDTTCIESTTKDSWVLVS